MKKTDSLLILMSVIAIVLTACSNVAAESIVTQPAAEESTTVSMVNNGMGMGRGSSMMARHHATIPEEFVGITNPVAATDDSLARGAEIYTTQCASCHGDGGMGDGPAAASLDPAPAPIAHSSQMLGDDYLYWRISEGGAMAPFNSTMIAWKGILDEDSRWDVINYVQGLGNGTVKPTEHMGGMAYDPDVELAQREKMLSVAVTQGVITQTEADTFALVHASIDEHMAAMSNIDNNNMGIMGNGNRMGMMGNGNRMGMMGNSNSMGGMDTMLNEMLAELISEGTLSQVQMDTFLDVHDRLDAAGLMQ